MGLVFMEDVCCCQKAISKNAALRQSFLSSSMIGVRLGPKVGTFVHNIERYWYAAKRDNSSNEAVNGYSQSR